MGWLEQIERGELDPPRRTTRVNEWGEPVEADGWDKARRRDTLPPLPVMFPPDRKRRGRAP